MMRNFSEILGAVGLILAVAVCLLATIGSSKAQEFAAERPGACDLSVGCNAAFPT